MLGFAQLQLLIFGRPQPVQVAADAGQDALIHERPDVDEVGAEPGQIGGQNVAESDVNAPAGDAVDDALPRDADANEAAAQLEIPQRRVTLGSLAEQAGYRLLVTLNSTGAAVERVELTNPRYRDLDDKSGYLGHLAGTNHPHGGVQIGVVGPGTPAALATCPNQPVGLHGPSFMTDVNGVTSMSQPGDRIVAIDGEEINNGEELSRTLSKTKPGQTVTIDVQREVNGDIVRLTYTTTLVERPLEIVRPEPLGEDEEVPHPLSFLTTMARVGVRSIALGDDEITDLPSLHHTNWATKVDQANGVVEFSRKLSAAELRAIGATGSLEFIKRYSLVPSNGEDEADDATGYLLDLDLEIRNTGEAPQVVAYQLDGPTGLPLEGWWYSTKVHPTKWSGAGARDVIWRPAGKKRFLMSCGQITSQAEDDPDSPDSLLIDSDEPVPMHFIGCDAQYFAAVLMPRPLAVAQPDDTQTDMLLDSAVARAVGPLDEERHKRTNVSYRVQSTPETIAPGGALVQNLSIFVGPKELRVLDQFGIGDAIVYGWFGGVSKPLVAILHFLYRIIPLYGIAIILLTVGVRGLMFPFGRKMALNAQKMQELAPEMKKIADKYKNDMEKRSKAQRELFAKHNYNPLAGCFMMFFQLPIFLGLYRGLSTDIQLRQAPLIPGLSWCSNLAGPDMFLDWRSWLPSSLSAETGWLGPYMNILPFVTVVLFMLHQKLFTPPPTDEQQKMQQTVMKVMMLFMGVMFHKVAAGLCIYFIASSLWGLGERLLLPSPKLATAGGSSAGGGSPGGGGSSRGGPGGGGGRGGIGGGSSKNGANGHASAKRRRKKAKRKR